jgi:hypothetical protein
MSIAHPLRAVLSFAICAAAAPALAVVTLDDPGNFQVKNTFSATSLGIPGPLAGLLFSADGNLLYVVGASETPTSALYGVPVTRDPLTGDVTGLGPAAAVTKVFDGTAATPGLDAGFEIGPGGTLFYTYWSSNRLGERPGGVTGAETQFNMGTVGVPSSVAGMTFSPHRTDPGTGFGMMQVSSWQGANLYEVPLTSAGAGIFTPGAVTLFVTLPQQGTGAIQYVPSGPLAGNLMYVNYNFGEVRLLTIDAATGLPVDKTSGLPTLGTANPTDSRFASGLGVGPWGLEFDPRTNDFFVATFRGDPANSIVQIGGAGFPPPSTTASTTTTITTTTTPTSSTTTPTSTTTTTTLASGCGVRAATFASIICRLEALLATVDAASDLGTTKTALRNGVAAALSKTQAADDSVTAGRKKPASNALKKAARKLIDFDHRLRSLRSRKNIPADTRAALLGDAGPILDDLKTLRKQL